MYQFQKRSQPCTFRNASAQQVRELSVCTGRAQYLNRWTKSLALQVSKCNFGIVKSPSPRLCKQSPQLHDKGKEAQFNGCGVALHNETSSFDTCQGPHLDKQHDRLSLKQKLGPTLS
jgi:hypothetical protein